MSTKTADANASTKTAEAKATDAPAAAVIIEKIVGSSSSSSSSSAASACNDSKRFDALCGSVFFVQVNRSRINGATPWNRTQSATSGTGFAVRIDGTIYLLTCAHVIIYAKTITVCRNGSSTRVQATVQHVNHLEDLAVLKIADDRYESDFWKDLLPFELSVGYPNLRDKCRVAGYPTGGTNFCTTSGEISRITMDAASHYGSYLPIIEISAPLNSGASGCPVLDVDQNVIGVGFQGYTYVNNVGHAIPAESVNRFVKLIKSGRSSEERPKLGIITTGLENQAVRDALKLPTTMTGVRVCASKPTMSPILADDVILSINGYAIGNDETISFRKPNERIYFTYAYYRTVIGDNCTVDVWRKQQVINLSFKLQPSIPAVVSNIYDNDVPYVTIGPYAFSVSYNETVDFGSNNAIFERIRKADVSDDCQQCVILLAPIAHALTIGISRSITVVRHCNGKPIRNLIDLVRCIDDATMTAVDDKSSDNGFLTLACGDPDVWSTADVRVVPVAAALKCHADVMSDFGIPNDASKDIRIYRERFLLAKK